jgi:hypothetical protein
LILGGAEVRRCQENVCMLKGILDERAFTTEGAESTEDRKSGKR